ncbi:CpsB/CapC family capsule biosynthesis tyrosine phosphatase [uncultured Lutibacter sp.]|uniref:tyrosine-protein phosphatase n=1 Tax=uncultured Lutibacter sp. TaxID=437739 RepID=UPI002608F472|nr:CpsB/CapC family capsule biosynthesis tyrosine phosphatase [uncultured Lutibacter sp.]
MLNFFKNKQTSITTNFPDDFVDIHSHILPGVDDGSQSFEDSLALLKKMHSYGINTIILTPHIMEGVWENSSLSLKKRFNEFNDFLKKVNFTEVQLKLAAEYMLDGNFNTLLKTEKLLTIKDNYLLIEMSYLNAPLNLYETLFAIQIAGYKPILAHPERYAFYHNNYAEYSKLKEAGCLFQLNLLSLTKYYGKEVTTIAKKLLKDNLIDFVGTDTHHDRHLNYLERINSTAIIKKLTPILKNNEVFK